MLSHLVRDVVPERLERQAVVARRERQLGDSPRNAQLVLERLEGDGVTLRVGEERRLCLDWP